MFKKKTPEEIFPLWRYYFLGKHCIIFWLDGHLNWKLGELTLESTACLRERKFITISWYTRIYFNGLHYGRQERVITWSNSSLFCTCRLHTKLYKFRRNCLPSNAAMKNCTDLNLSDVFCLSIIYHIPDSWLNLLNGYDFYFRCKPPIICRYNWTAD